MAKNNHVPLGKRPEVPGETLQQSILEAFRFSSLFFRRQMPDAQRFRNREAPCLVEPELGRSTLSRIACDGREPSPELHVGPSGFAVGKAAPGLLPGIPRLAVFNRGLRAQAV